MRAVSVAVLAIVSLGACVDQGAGPQPRKVDPAYIKEHLLAAAPTDLERFDVAVGDKLIYLGNQVDRRRVAPGGVVTITHYWKVLAPVGPRWKVFGHLRGPARTADFMNLPATEMQRGHGPAKWEAGQIIADVQAITIRPDWRSPSATVLVGLIEVDGHRTLDRMEVDPKGVAGARVRDRAIVAANLEIDLARAPPPPGTVHVPRAKGPITIDGRGDDPGWVGAVTSPELVTAEGSPEPFGKATAKLTWDDEHLYVWVTVTDSDVYSPYKDHDDPLWKADCVELFIDADGDRRGYIELQVNPNNATFDAWFAGPRGPAGDQAWDSGMRTAVTVRGNAAVSGDTDQGWDAEIAIPLAAVKGRNEAMNVRLPPAVGDRWKLNLVRVDKKSGSETVTASSWNRITYSDFHALDRMLTVVFADESGSVVPAKPATGSGT